MSDSMLLTDEERRRFAEYLRREAETSDAMAIRVQEFSPPTAKALRTRVAACIIVAKFLDATESQTV